MNSALERKPAAPGNNLEGKVAIVTGSTSGIGLGVAKALAGQGATVVLNGFGKPADIERLRAEFGSSFGRPAGYSPADMSRPEEIGPWSSRSPESAGAWTFSSTMPGVQHVAPLEEFPNREVGSDPGDQSDRGFPHRPLALPHMRRTGFGRIINVASAHGLIASPFKSAYVAAKHGLVGLTKTIALERPKARSPATPSVPATSGRPSSSSRSRARRRRMACHAIR